MRSYAFHREHTYPKLNREPTQDELRREQWHACPSYPQWEASSLGRIRSAKTRHIQKLQVSHDGYGVLDNGRTQVSRLVADAFLPTYPVAVAAKYEVDHINGRKWDNRPENLQLLSHRANVTKDYGRPVMFGPTIYPSIAKAAEAIGRSRCTIRRWAVDGLVSLLGDASRNITGATYQPAM